MAELIASRREEHAPRGSHGVLLSEATDPGYDPAKWDRAGGFVVDTPLIDYAALALQQAQDDYAKRFPESKTPFLWRVRLEKFDQD